MTCQDTVFCRANAGIFIGTLAADTTNAGRFILQRGDRWRHATDVQFGPLPGEQYQIVVVDVGSPQWFWYLSNNTNSSKNRHGLIDACSFLKGTDEVFADRNFGGSHYQVIYMHW
jgi:hypothetical protein